MRQACSPLPAGGLLALRQSYAALAVAPLATRRAGMVVCWCQIAYGVEEIHTSRCYAYGAWNQVIGAVGTVVTAQPADRGCAKDLRSGFAPCAAAAACDFASHGACLRAHFYGCGMSVAAGQPCCQRGPWYGRVAGRPWRPDRGRTGCGRGGLCHGAGAARGQPMCGWLLVGGRRSVRLRWCLRVARAHNADSSSIFPSMRHCPTSHEAPHAGQ